MSIFNQDVKVQPEKCPVRPEKCPVHPENTPVSMFNQLHVHVQPQDVKVQPAMCPVQPGIYKRVCMCCIAFHAPWLFTGDVIWLELD